ncbi:MAG: UMP kinase [Candidatus Micrarchaeota archaeon]|nr:UMP kinase [Candidatus Micrarchaeota archaeon]
MAQTVVLSLGGSLVNPGKPDRKYVRRLVELLKATDYKFGIVVGGGKLARTLAEAVRKKGAGEFEADEAAIWATKKNAKFVISALGRSQTHASPCESFAQARQYAKKYRFVVMGGTIPGITTDSDAALLAECLHAKRLVNLSNVDGIYSSNPYLEPNAKKFKRISYQKLINLAGRYDLRKAGTHFIFDFLACKLIARSKIETHFVHGKNFSDVRNAIEGKPHGGTVVK